MKAAYCWVNIGKVEATCSPGVRFCWSEITADLQHCGSEPPEGKQEIHCCQNSARFTTKTTANLKNMRKKALQLFKAFYFLI